MAAQDPNEDLEEIARTMVAICTNLPTIDAACIYPAVWDAQSHVRFAGTPLPVDGDPGPAFLPDDLSVSRSVARVLASGRTCYLGPADLTLQSGLASESTISSLKALYLLPLGSRERMVGILCAGATAACGISRASRRRLDLLFPLLALAIKKARLREHAAASDPPVSASDDPALRPPMNTVACLAHDIKNAMTTISTFFQLLPAKWNDPHFRTTFYPVARDETFRASSLVNTLFDQGRKQHMRREPVEFGAMLKTILAAKAPLAEHRRLRFQVQADAASPTIRVDRSAVEEAIVNLLANAMEASPEGGCIAVRLENDFPPNGRPAIRLEIQDEGPGIDKELQDAIFAPYVSTKGDLAMAGGRGLGLPIARHHIETHGGTIEFEKGAEGGALFRVTLPVERRRY